MPDYTGHTDSLSIQPPSPLWSAHLCGWTGLHLVPQAMLSWSVIKGYPIVLRKERHQTLYSELLDRTKAEFLYFACFFMFFNSLPGLLVLILVSSAKEARDLTVP